MGNNIIVKEKINYCVNPYHSFEVVKSFPVPVVVYSASLHPSRQTFVAGGEDFKIYKFDFEEAKELGQLSQ